MNPGTEMCILPDGQGAHLGFSEPLATGRFDVSDPDRFWQELDTQTLHHDDWLVVYVSFEACLERLGLPTAQSPHLPAAQWWRFSDVGSGPDYLPVPAVQWQPHWSLTRYRRAFERIHRGILDGEIYQINLTLRAHGVAERLDNIPVSVTGPRSAWLSLNELTLLSASPECFLQYEAATRQLATYPIKGTRAHSLSAQLLQDDPKERAEHIMVVDMCRNDLGRVCMPGSIAVEPLMGRMRLRYAHHLESRVYGRLTPNLRFSQALPQLLPVASISGTPKVQACRVIQAVEDQPRGPYTGVLGWISPTGDAYFTVLIRTAWQDESGWHYGTGGGIVADSDPNREYDEALLKLQALTELHRVPLES